MNNNLFKRKIDKIENNNNSKNITSTVTSAFPNFRDNSCISESFGEFSNIDKNSFHKFDD